MNRKCLTNGMVLHTFFQNERILMTIETPNQEWDETAAKEIDERLHDGIEFALAPYWNSATLEGVK